MYIGCVDCSKPITITKVVSRNFIMDIVAKFQNMIGMNIKGSAKKGDKTSLQKQIRRTIAQINTLLNEKRRDNNGKEM